MHFPEGLTFSVLFLALLNGLFSFVSPCILPLIPSYVSYITGMSYDQLTDPQFSRKNMTTTLLHSVLFVAGFSVIFVLLGASASLLGGLLSEYLDSIRILGGLFVILMGIFVMDIIKIPFLQQEAKLHLKTRPAGYVGTFIIGMVFGAGWTPCTGPFLGSVLAMAMESATVFKGMVLLTFYSLGLGIPFVLSAIAISAFFISFNSLKRYFRVIKIVSGIILVIIGILLIMDKLTLLIPR